MSAEDDYPAYGAIGGTAELDHGLYEKAMAEIDRLRAERGLIASAAAAYRELATCYRTGRQPSERLHRELAAAAVTMATLFAHASPARAPGEPSGSG